VRICVEAMGVNRHMTPDKVKVALMGELLHCVHGSRYIKTLDLTSAFLHVLLAKSYRKWAAFNFETVFTSSLEFHMGTKTPFQLL